MRRLLKKYLPDHESIHSNRWLRPFASSLLHPRLWHLNRHSAAGAVAAGMFCGLIPGPLQILATTACALVFRVNLPLAMLVTFYTNPLTIVPLYIVAYQIGRRLVGDASNFVAPPSFDPGTFVAWTAAMQEWMIGAAKPLAIGLFILACGLAVLGYLTTKAAWRFYLIRSWRQRLLKRTNPAAQVPVD